MAAKPSSSCLVDWEVLIPLGPAVAFHVGCVVNNSVYLHGGIEIKGSNSPSNKLFKLDLESLIWNQIISPDSPALSHHVCLVQDDRYIMIIGGWNGKSRGCKVYIYDTVENKWTEPQTTGFPEDGGLSSHTVNELSDGKILIVGRDGSLRMQRRHGNAYLLAGLSTQHTSEFRFDNAHTKISVIRYLSGDPANGYKYSEFSNAVTSRSGHTTSIIGTKVFVIGGRSDKLVDVYSGYSNKHTHTNSIIENLVSAASKLKALDKFPSGRKHHISLPVPGGLFLHGGETFDGKCREPVGDMYLMTVKPVGNFYKLGTSSVGRSGHICVVYKDKVLLHGGISGKSASVRCETFELKLKF